MGWDGSEFGGRLVGAEGALDVIADCMGRIDYFLVELALAGQLEHVLTEGKGTL